MTFPTEPTSQLPEHIQLLLFKKRDLLNLQHKKRIWLSPPHMSGLEQQYIQEAFDTNWIAPSGSNIDHFEKEIGNYIGDVHVAALSSGTAALHLALILLGVGQDDIVLCQSLTFVASANPILYQKAIPVFIDSEISTWNICPNALENAIKDLITKGKTPKALIVVHLYGMPAKMKEIKFICDQFGILIIEDAAESLGSRYYGKQTGSLGDIGIISFNGNKIITTSGGGALISRSKTLVSKARFLATQARDDTPYYQHSEIGYNYRMSNICAGIGRGQLKILDQHIENRRANFRFYQKAFHQFPRVTFQEEPDSFYFSNRWLTAILIDPREFDDRDTNLLREKLSDQNIESRPVWKPLHMQPVFKGALFYGSGIAQRLFLNGLCLPSGSSLTEEDLLRVTSVLLN